jgi:3-hydroxypropionyl-CoA synthetase (ADP-forming)
MGPDIAQWMRGLKSSNGPDEYEVKQLLKQRGMEVPDGFVVEVGAEIDLKDLKGPYAAKVCSPEIRHKYDLGGVVLDLNENDISDAVEIIQNKFPEARVLVEQMCDYSGTEFIIGSTVDPVLGPAIMAGAGGILTELYKDIAFRLSPCTLDGATEMLDGLIIAPIFNGFRGISLDKRGLAEIISNVSYLVDEIGDKFSQLDINPIVYSQNKWVILDAKLTLSGL